jgi:transposase
LLRLAIAHSHEAQGVSDESSGQAEGQINRLKTLKRAMFGRAGIELLRARMLPLN